MDCYAVVKYVYENFEEFGIDQNSISIYGESAGGYMACGVSMILAQKKESNIVKTVFMDMPMIYAGWLRDAETMNEVEQNWKDQHLAGMKLLCTDHEAQFASKDPFIFPAEMDKELLKLVPNTVVMTREFDFYRADAEYYAERLQ